MTENASKNLFDHAKIELSDGPSFAAEIAMMKSVTGFVCGVDEVGRGPLAGPVVAAAVILDADNIPDGLNDSKKLSAKKRQALALQIQEQALAVSIAQASVDEIDEINILAATMLAMRRAVDGLSVTPVGALVDGNRAPGLSIETQTLVKGDSKSLSIAAASIVAKVFRDDLMAKLGEDWPAYGWASNAGYGVKKHKQALELVGVSPHHRKSFEPIRSILNRDTANN